jgi:glycosyltransferase involved in cell wall biosynthesis
VRIVLLCRALTVGGVERQVVNLAKTLHRRGVDVSVMVFYAGALDPELHAADVPLINLRKQSRWDVLSFLVRGVRVVRTHRPDTIYGFLSTSNLLAALFKVFVPDVRIVWGLRSAHVDVERYDWLFRFAYRCEARLSRFADLIICNSSAGLEHAARRGFPRDRMVVVPNGIDTEHFRPDATARAQLRQQWQVAERELLVGLVARLDAMKDHPTFLRAAALLLAQRPNVRFVCVGGGGLQYAAELKELAASLGLNGALIWAGEHRAMPAVFNALDVAASSSSGEGFSNTIAEAMACGVPCVVTDVGDSAAIVGPSGEVVAPRSAQALCDGLGRLLDRTGSELRQRARSLIVERFTDDALGAATLDAIGVLK